MGIQNRARPEPLTGCPLNPANISKISWKPCTPLAMNTTPRPQDVLPDRQQAPLDQEHRHHGSDWFRSRGGHEDRPRIAR